MQIFQNSEKSLTLQKLYEMFFYCQETGLFIRKIGVKGSSAGAVSGSQMSKGYLQIGVNKRKYLAHRLAWFYVYKVWPDGQIDHINGIKTDNRIENLRCVTNKQNHENSGIKSSNSSGFRGVSFYKRDGTWTAQLTHNYKNIYLGRFATKEQAAQAAQEGRAKFFTHSSRQK